MGCLLQQNGQDIIIRVGKQKDLPQVPNGFPVCGDFPGSAYQSRDDVAREANQPETDPTSVLPVTSTSISFSTLVIVLSMCVMFMVILIVVILCRPALRRHGNGYSKIKDGIAMLSAKEKRDL